MGLCLVAGDGNMTGWFFHLLGIGSPIDFHIFQRGWNNQPVVLAGLASYDMYVECVCGCSVIVCTVMYNMTIGFEISTACTYDDR